MYIDIYAFKTCSLPTIDDKSFDKDTYKIKNILHFSINNYLVIQSCLIVQQKF